MELHIQSHHWERRMPDWLAAAVAGVVGGALVIVLEFFWSTMVLNESPWRPTHKIAAMVMGPSALEQTSLFSYGIVATALVLHYVLGAIMGMILGAVIAPFHFDSSVGMEAVIGVAFGIVAYVWNFYVMTAVFPWFVSERGAGPLLANLLFGAVTAIAYGMLERRTRDAMPRAPRQRSAPPSPIAAGPSTVQQSAPQDRGPAAAEDVAPADEEYRSADGRIRAVLVEREGGIVLDIQGEGREDLSAIVQSLRHLLTSIVRR